MIDLVITWLDDKDPKWQSDFQEEKKHVLSQIGTVYHKDGLSINRFHNRNELFFALKSIKRNMPFIRQVFLVTANQIPNWYSEKEFPNVKLIYHSEIFQNVHDLPTFNSNAIEAHLHRIQELSELFIYMNDDLFILRKTKFSDFFFRGKMKVYVTDESAIKGIPTAVEPSWISAWKNTNQLLDNRFGRAERQFLAHTPLILSKSLIEMAWKEFEEPLKRTSSRKFRSKDTCLTTAGLFPYYAIYKGAAELVICSKKICYAIRIGDHLGLNSLEFLRVKLDYPKFLSLADMTEMRDKKVDEQIKAFLDSLPL